MDIRTEKEMYDLILNFAYKDERIRAVGMEGSRVNPNVPKDMFQDYDVSYFVTDMESFKESDSWLDMFGERIIMQKPEQMSLFPPELGGWFSYLMLFTDGNRIDLKLIPVTDSDLYRKSDKLIKILMDKDNILGLVPPPSDIDYHVKQPTKEFFEDNCNEFRWVSTYVAKGLWRNEILYANAHINDYLRPALLRSMEWKAGITTGFSKSVGKNYKYLSDFVTEWEWQELLKTYKNSNYDDCWESLFTMFKLFGIVSSYIAEKFGYVYLKEEEQKVLGYLEYVYNLAQLK